MDLYLIRHADALPVGEHGITEDATRPLSETGIAESRRLAAGLPRRGVRLDLVLSSPLVRARQTAEHMLALWLAPVPELKTCAELAPGLKPRKLIRLLRKIGQKSVALVGHQPDLGDLAAWLVGSKKAQIDLAKGGVACIACAEEPGKGAGVLTWLVTQEWLKV